VKRGVRGPRTRVARAPRRGVRHARGPSVSFELGRAYPKVGSCELPRASRPVMRSIDVCTPKPFQLEHSYFVASQRDDPSRREAFQRQPKVIHVPKPRGFVLVLAERLLCEPQPHRSSEDARSCCGHPLARGRRIRTRPGRVCVSRAGSHFGDRAVLVGRRFLPPHGTVSVRLWHSCRLLFLAGWAPHFSEHRASIQRPPRSVPRGPREKACALPIRNAFPLQPSLAARTSQKLERTRVTFLEQRHSRDEDGRSSKNHLPFAGGVLARLRD